VGRAGVARRRDVTKSKDEFRVDDEDRPQTRHAGQISATVRQHVCADHQTQPFEEIPERGGVDISRSPYLPETIIGTKAPHGIVGDQEQRDTEAANLGADALDVGLIAVDREIGNKCEYERIPTSAPQKAGLT